MKKLKITAIVLGSVVVLAALAVGAALFISNLALRTQAEIYETYAAMQENIEKLTVTVTENGQEVGSYSLEALGVRKSTARALDARYDGYGRMRPEVFAQISMPRRLQWFFGEKPQKDPMPVAADGLDAAQVLKALDTVSREAPQDAKMEYTEGRFFVTEEVPGTVLDEAKVQAVLTETVASMAVGVGSPAEAAVELTEHDCYVLPEVTVENAHFDFEGCLDNSLKDLTLTVDFHGDKATVSNARIRDMMRVTEDGAVEVDEAAITELVDGWHKEFRYDGTPYLFKAQVGGIKPIDFLLVDYEVNKEATAEAVKEALLSLKQTEMEPVWYCWRKGEAFAIEGEYVEVDIPNQKMTYVKDNEVIVSTDVVTGATWGYPTPPGYYKVENKDTNCWLEGADYNVHVDYWIGFIGYTVGIHDADWRTKFGGTNYVRNGSHGCVNTPKEAVIPIFENIEVGVPVLVYGK